GNALAFQLDVRDDDNVAAVVAATVERFGGIDGLINNAGAIKLMPVEMLPPKRFDLLWGVNVRAAYVMSHHCIPYLEKSDAGHIVSMSPPLNMKTKWIAGKTG